MPTSEATAGSGTQRRTKGKVRVYSRGWDRSYSWSRPVPYLRDGEMGVRMSWENWDRMGMPTVEIRAEAGGRGNKQRTAHVEDYNIDALRPEDRAELRSYYLEAWALARKWTDEVVRKVTRA